jgi:phosphoglycerate-specific signal transduction histidine kinase
MDWSRLFREIGCSSQVMLNLIINALEAMSDVAGGARELLINTAKAETSRVLVVRYTELAPDQFKDFWR